MALIPFDDRDGVIWMNGEMVEWRDARTEFCVPFLEFCHFAIRSAWAQNFWT